MKPICLFVAFFILGFSLTLVYLPRFLVFKSLPSAETPPAALISPTPVLPQFSYDHPPSSALVGQVLAAAGDVRWQPRTATQASQFTLPHSVTQGESLVTGPAGRAKINFTDIATISAYPITSLSFIQTLPADLVIEQGQGRADYVSTGKVPVTIRSHYLLVDLNSANVTYSVDASGLYLIGDVQSGSVTLAYNDLNQISQLKTVPAGYRFILVNRTRRLSLRRF